MGKHDMKTSAAEQNALMDDREGKNLLDTDNPSKRLELLRGEERGSDMNIIAKNKAKKILKPQGGQTLQQHRKPGKGEKKIVVHHHVYHHHFNQNGKSVDVDTQVKSQTMEETQQTFVDEKTETNVSLPTIKG